MSDSGDELKSLGAKSEFKYNAPDAAILEWFDNPFSSAKQNPNNVEASIYIEAPEFTSLCPVTGQPDFAVIVIEYIPGERCLESKSLKLYLGGFRMHGEFHEACVNRICNDLATLLKPVWLKVEGRFTSRGGIKFWPVAEYEEGGARR